MPPNYDIHLRIEPRPSHQADQQRGFMAEIADPAWFVGRQWQMGEHQGENAASPVLARVTYGRRPLQPAPGRPGLFPGHRMDADPAVAPAITPAEAIIEGEAGDWWTLGRRIRIGQTASSAVDAIDMPVAERTGLRLPPLPEPYAEFSGGYDGWALHKAVLAGGLLLDPALFASVPAASPLPASRRDDHWLAAELKYGQVGFAGDTGTLADQPDLPRLVVSDHEGGEVEWWSADAEGDWGAQIPEELQKQGLHLQPARFSYPGAPHPRWWQIEDARVDIGGFPPDRSHLASLLLLDLVLAHSDDWFTLALEAQVGDVVTIQDLVVVDLFCEEHNWATHPRLRSPGDWSLFQVAGLDSASLVIWPTVAVPTVGEALEEVALGVDEDANLMWAVEERAEGLRLASLDLDSPASPTVRSNPGMEVATTSAYLYRPSTYVPHHWHPYVVQEVANRRAFVQGRLADYSSVDVGQIGKLAPAPIARLLQDPGRSDQGPMHYIEPAVVPATGLRLDRRYVLARQTSGAPVLWVQRQRLPLFSPPATRLRFDVMAPTTLETTS